MDVYECGRRAQGGRIRVVQDLPSAVRFQAREKLEPQAPEENRLQSLRLYLVVGFQSLQAGQPVDANSAACRVAPELDELLNREDTSEVLNRPAVLDVASLD